MEIKAGSGGRLKYSYGERPIQIIVEEQADWIRENKPSLIAS